jgi:ParB family chromosome partitioning protein
VVTVVSVAEVDPDPEQPRRPSAGEALAELAASIRERGVLQPIVVRRAGTRYQVLAGERRWRAARLAGVDRLPVLVREHGEPLEIALIENVQREDLDALEEAEALSLLIERHGYSHREVAYLLGKSRPYVSNTLALKRLPAAVKMEIRRAGRSCSREVLIGIARQPDEAAAVALWERLKIDTMSVRRFREERGAGRGRPPARAALAAARRLNRTLRRMRGTRLPAEDFALLRRVLRRTRRLARALMSEPAPA